LNGVGSTDEQSRQQSKRAPVEPMQRLQRASVEPMVEHRMIRQNQAQSSVQLSRGTAKRRSEHRLNRRQQNPSVGAIDQRDHKAKSAEHRLNRRRQTSIRRATAKTARRDRYSGFTDFTDACGTKASVQPSRTSKTLKYQDPTHRLIRRGQLQSVGSSGARKNRVQKPFSARDLWNFR